MEDFRTQLALFCCSIRNLECSTSDLQHGSMEARLCRLKILLSQVLTLAWGLARADPTTHAYDADERVRERGRAMPYESPARVQTRRSAAAMATLNGGGGLSLADEHSQPQQQQQPHAVVAQRQLGSIGAGRSGRGYSPYARRIQTRAAQYDRQDDDDEEELGQQQPQQQEPSPTRQQSTGLFGKVRSLPGRMLGLLSRSSSRQSGLSSSTSLADVRAELDHQLRKEEGER